MKKPEERQKKPFAALYYENAQARLDSEHIRILPPQAFGYQIKRLFIDIFELDDGSVHVSTLSGIELKFDNSEAWTVTDRQPYSAWATSGKEFTVVLIDEANNLTIGSARIPQRESPDGPISIRPSDIPDDDQRYYRYKALDKLYQAKPGETIVWFRESPEEKAQKESEHFLTQERALLQQPDFMTDFMDSSDLFENLFKIEGIISRLQGDLKNKLIFKLRVEAQMLESNLSDEQERGLKVSSFIRACNLFPISMLNSRQLVIFKDPSEQDPLENITYYLSRLTNFGLDTDNIIFKLQQLSGIKDVDQAITERVSGMFKVEIDNVLDHGKLELVFDPQDSHNTN